MQLDFIIGGAQKAASTTLLRSLMSHPQLHLDDAEYSFFEEPKAEQRAQEYLQTLCSNSKTSKNVLHGIKRPNILADKNAHENIYKHNPKMKFIFILRDPLARYLSAYCHHFFRGEINEPDINKTVPKSKSEKITHHYTKSLLANSLYGESLSHLETLFTADQIFIINQTDFFNEPKSTLKKICVFLEINQTISYTNNKSQTSVYNSTRLKLGNWVSRFLFKQVNSRKRTHRLGKMGYYLWAGYRKFDSKILSIFFKKRGTALSSKNKINLKQIFLADYELFSERTKIKHKTWIK